MSLSEDTMKRIAVIPWPNIENCYLCLSGPLVKKGRYGDKFYRDIHIEHFQNWDLDAEIQTTPRVTFTYKDDDIAAEWDGAYGPIQRWFKCEKDHAEAREHWLYEYAYGSGHWSQLAVEENALCYHFNKGNYQRIFEVLKNFVTCYKNTQARV